MEDYPNSSIAIFQRRDGTVYRAEFLTVFRLGEQILHKATEWETIKFINADVDYSPSDYSFRPHIDLRGRAKNA